MKILFDRRSAVGQKSGVGFYVSELLAACGRVSADHQVDLFPNGTAWRGYQVYGSLRSVWRQWRARAKGLRPPRLLIPLLGALRIGGRHCRNAFDALLRRHLRALIAENGYDLYHEPNFLPMEMDLPTVLTVHDLSVIRHPEWHPADRVRKYDSSFLRGVRRARHFITVSETVRRQVIDLLNVPAGQVTAIHNGTHPHLRPMPENEASKALARLGLRPGYLLHVGTVEPRKNLLLLMQAYCALPRLLRERCPLVLVGGWGWRYEKIASYHESHARHHGVRLLGYVPTRYLAALYNGARALVYPSLDEGFGLPAVEMLACGGAVLASDIEVFRETIGGQALLVPPDDADGWREAMTDIILDDDLWHLLRLGGVETARKYCWEECAARTLAVYRGVAGESSAPKDQTIHSRTIKSRREVAIDRVAG